MKRILRQMLLLLIIASSAIITPGIRARSAPSIPNPILIFVGSEFVTSGGKQYTRYRYNVFNFGEFPDSLFAASPNLPPCGNNTKASRTWVDFYDSSGKRLNGFCALGKAADLNQIWFAMETDLLPPSWVYIELSDRQTSTKYKSNLAETVE